MTAMIRRIAARETGVSLHHEGPIEVLLKLSVHHSTFALGGLSRALNWAPIISRNASLVNASFQ